MNSLAMSLLVEAEDADNFTSPGDDPAYLLAKKIVAGSSCILSVLGALLVMFSFAYNGETKFSLKELVYYRLCCGYSVVEKPEGADREWVTKYRLKSYNFILINLSIADIIVAVSHLWGLASNLEKKFTYDKSNISRLTSGQDVSCTTQAAFTVLSTLSSFFWTDILAIFLAFNIAFKTCTNTRLSNLQQDLERNGGKTKVLVSPTSCCDTPLFLYVIFPLIGWGIPMSMLVAFGAKNMLGYNGIGWCYFYLPNTLPNHQIMDVLGYELWLWSSIVIVLVCTSLYATCACIRGRKSPNFKTECTHIRYFSVGIAFAMLRIPSTILNFYVMTTKNHHDTVAAAFLYFVSNATTSLQGGVNGIIYLCCRTNMKKRCCCYCEPQNPDENRPLVNDT